MFLQLNIIYKYHSALCSLCLYNSGVHVKRRTAAALCVFFLHALTAPVSHGLFEVHPSHSDTSHLVRLLWTSDQPDAETSNRQHKTLARYKLPCPQRDLNPQSQQASGRIPTPQTARPFAVPTNCFNKGQRSLSSLTD